ncbi:MAG: terpene cyclase/mutase family protein [Planctomycetes bacterium]|nr:terpene cyclase/mutase family protein [Planctomycetota bacterium]
MTPTWRPFVWLLVAGCLLLVAGGAPAVAGEASDLAAIDRALERGVAYLITQQAPDGAWRSTRYPPFGDGASLTAAILEALSTLPDQQPAREARARGLDWFVWRALGDCGSPDTGQLSYPVYTAGSMASLLARDCAADPFTLRTMWTDLLVEWQLNAALDWREDDDVYGGWNYAHEPTRKPKGGAPLGPLAEPNLSATVAAIEALAANGRAEHRAALTAARRFVERCQNFGDDPAFDDGGFFFIQRDPVRNKAGARGHDAQGRERFSSYGSATADGLRALQACGLDEKHPRVAAAWRWLDEHFDPERHPGEYARGRTAAQPALYYYYAHSLTRAWLGREPSVETASRAESLARALVRRQAVDGSWSNTAVDVREDDPLVATPAALAALAHCRQLITAQLDANAQGQSVADR